MCALALTGDVEIVVAEGGGVVAAACALVGAENAAGDVAAAAEMAAAVAVEAEIDQAAGHIGGVAADDAVAVVGTVDPGVPVGTDRHHTAEDEQPSDKGSLTYGAAWVEGCERVEAVKAVRG